MKPRVNREDSLTDQEYQALTARWEEMLALAEGILWNNYLNPDSDDLLSNGARNCAIMVAEGGGIVMAQSLESIRSRIEALGMGFRFVKPIPRGSSGATT